MRKLCAILFLTAAVCGANSALAVQQFQNAFMDKYIKDHKDKKFSEYVTTKVKCFICHQGKLKKNHNPYGVHLVDLLDRKKDARDVKKINEALDKVAAMHSDPKDDKSPTYGEMIAAGKLPGGELEAVKKEPAKEDEKKSE